MFGLHGEEEFNFYGQSRNSSNRLVSALKAWKMLANGCQGYLANMVDKEKEAELKPEDVPIIREYVDVFPKELPGLPPER